MKASCFIRISAILAIVACISPVLQAQQPVAGSSNVLRVKKFVGIGRQTIIKTPVYDTSAARSVTREKEWTYVWVEYETAPEWIDEIVFQYHVLAKTKVEGKEAFSLYKKSVKYIDVEKGRNHFSTVFLRPNAIKRYGEIVASAVEISINGKAVALKSELGMKLPADWWKNAAVTESAAVTVRDGYLLDRAQTPFANVNVDDYEVIK
jgi:hypothetical protein